MKSLLVKKRALYDLVYSAFISRGFSKEEAKDLTYISTEASRNGIQSHNAIKALHLDELFGSSKGGCKPNANIELVCNKFESIQVWNSNFKSGPTVAFNAINKCIELANKYGTGTVVVDNAFHYLWGGGYVIEAAKRGYIAYTSCTSLLAEVVPHSGISPTIGTNPHSWAFPTSDIVGFPILIDWATSIVSMGKVQASKRAGKLMDKICGLDHNGIKTDDPAKIISLLPFGEHKGYGLGLVNELIAGYVGGYVPTIRGNYNVNNKKNTTCFYFQIIHPEAISARNYYNKNSVGDNIKAIINDIKSGGNEEVLLPGEIEANWVKINDAFGGIVFTESEINEFNKIAEKIGSKKLQVEEIQIKKPF